MLGGTFSGAPLEGPTGGLNLGPHWGPQNRPPVGASSGASPFLGNVTGSKDGAFDDRWIGLPSLRRSTWRRPGPDGASDDRWTGLPSLRRSTWRRLWRSRKRVTLLDWNRGDWDGARYLTCFTRLPTSDSPEPSFEPVQRPLTNRWAAISSPGTAAVPSHRGQVEDVEKKSATTKNETRK